MEIDAIPMERARLKELQYITPIGNLPSIMQRGLLSNRLARPLQPESLAMQEVQDIRATKGVPGGRALHEYVNLYVCARNPMLFKRLEQRHETCVLAVSTDVLDLAGVVVTDQNAASKYVRFSAGSAGLANVNEALTFADSWESDDQIQYWRQKSAKCAEVLVPDVVGPQYIMHAHVCSPQAVQLIAQLGLQIQANVNQELFFGFH